MLSKIDTSAIDDLIDSITKIPGDKIVTLMVQGESEPFVIDVSADGKFGYHKSHELLFRAKLASAFSSSGGMIIRQFLSVKVQRKMPDGKKVWIPRKKIYAIFIAKGKWYPLSKEEVRKACCTDAETGKPIPPEPDVSFSDFPV